MSEYTVYFNPRCGTCQKVKQRLEDRGVKIRLIEYLKEPPTEAALETILQKLGAGPESITRFKEPLWEEKKIDAARFPRKEWIKLLAENPVLIERPIVVTETRAVVARPPEKVEELFD
jgi:arsenate reductase (glutaredoxin)